MSVQQRPGFALPRGNPDRQRQNMKRLRSVCQFLLCVAVNHVVRIPLQLKFKVLSQETEDLKVKARRSLEKASKESGVSRLENRPDLDAAFKLLPNTLADIEDLIHELRAQAEACVGTDQSVGVVIAKGVSLCKPLQLTSVGGRGVPGEGEEN